MNEFETKLSNALCQYHIETEPETITKLYDYYDRIVQKNKVMNLTAITGVDDFIQKHFVDSLSLIPHTKIGQQIANGKILKVIDVGCGCGLPGLALKIVYPQLEMVLMDSLKKRLVFLDEVIDALRLEKVVTLHGRAEDLGHDKQFREKFDLATARAVANMSTLAEYCLPFVRTGGCFAAYKGQDIHAELDAAQSAISLLGGKTGEISDFLLPGTDMNRSIAVIQKVKSTPAAYSRKAGTPAKEPL